LKKVAKDIDKDYPELEKLLSERKHETKRKQQRNGFSKREKEN